MTLDHVSPRTIANGGLMLGRSDDVGEQHRRQDGLQGRMRTLDADEVADLPGPCRKFLHGPREAGHPADL
jgi:hypothetical protein